MKSILKNGIVKVEFNNLCQEYYSIKKNIEKLQLESNKLYSNLNLYICTILNRNEHLYNLSDISHKLVFENGNPVGVKVYINYELGFEQIHTQDTTTQYFTLKELFAI